MPARKSTPWRIAAFQPESLIYIMSRRRGASGAELGEIFGDVAGCIQVGLADLNFKMSNLGRPKLDITQIRLGCRLIPIKLGLERPLLRHANVGGLFRRQLRQLRADLGEMQRGDLFVEVLRERIDLALVLALLGP